MTYSSITYQDSGAKKTAVRVEGATSHAALETLATGLQTHSNCATPYTGFVKAHPAPGTAVNAVYRSVEDKAVLSFKDANDRTVKISIAAPKDAIFDHSSNPIKVLAAIGNDVATKMSTATGKTLTFVGGVKWGKPKRG